MANIKVGKLPKRYAFALNRYKSERFSQCPKCNGLMNMRKFALFIHVDGWGPLSMGKTCRYCPRCEFIIAHQDDLEKVLTGFFKQHGPDKIGKDYFVLGTASLKSWKEGARNKAGNLQEALEHVSDFSKILTLKVDCGGWCLPVKGR